MNNNMNNTTYGEEGALSCGYPSVSLLQQTTRAGSVLLVLICSLVGNIFVLRVVRKNIKLHSVTHYLIVNLAVADLLITVFNMTELFKIEVTGSEQTFGGVAGEVYCIGSIVILNLSVACSILSLSAISIERFCSIIFPFKRIITLPRAKGMLVTIWVFSFLITIPFFFNMKTEDYYGDGVFYCIEDWSPLDSEKAAQVFQVIFFLLMYACPLTVILVLYLIIGVNLWRRQVSVKASLGNSQRRTRMTVQVIKMLVTSVVAFALCWLPQHVALFIGYFRLDICPPEFLWFGGQILGYANSTMNPIIYIAFHSEYRKEFKVVLARFFPICRGHRKGATTINLQKQNNPVELGMVSVLSFKVKLSDGLRSEFSDVNSNSPFKVSRENQALNRIE